MSVEAVVGIENDEAADERVDGYSWWEMMAPFGAMPRGQGMERLIVGAVMDTDCDVVDAVDVVVAEREGIETESAVESCSSALGASNPLVRLLVVVVGT